MFGSSKTIVFMVTYNSADSLKENRYIEIPAKAKYEKLRKKVKTYFQLNTDDFRLTYNHNGKTITMCSDFDVKQAASTLKDSPIAETQVVALELVMRWSDTGMSASDLFDNNAMYHPLSEASKMYYHQLHMNSKPKKKKHRKITGKIIALVVNILLATTGSMLPQLITDQ